MSSDNNANNNDKKDADVKIEEKKPYYGEDIKKGDLIKLDMMGSTVPNAIESKSIVFQASNLEDAKKMASYDPKKPHLYTPELVLVGEKGFVLDKIDAELQKMKYGEEKIVVLEPKDAFGDRDPSKIEKMAPHKFIKVMNTPPKLGAEYHDEKGRHGTVISMDQGRIRVDFNHPLAGRKVQYKLKALERIDKFEDKVLAYLGRRMQGTLPDLFKIDYKEAEKTIDITVPEYFAFQQNIGYAEFGSAYDLQNYLKVDIVNFIHQFKKRPEPVPQDSTPQDSATQGSDSDNKEQKPENASNSENDNEKKSESNSEEESKKEKKSKKKSLS